MTEPSRTSARYRRVEVRMWGDAAFRSLSAPAPNGQSLWQHLLTGRHTSIIPGLSAVREVTLADALGWSLEGFREAFREVSGQSRPKVMAKADWNAGVVWLHKAIRHNPPQSPNVIRSWRGAWEDIPECALKIEAYQALRLFLSAMGEPFLKAFDEVIADPSPKLDESFPKAFREGCADPSPQPSPQPSPNQDQDQDQDQEQEQEQEQDARVRAGDLVDDVREAGPSRSDVLCPVFSADRMRVVFQARYLAERGVDPSMGGRNLGDFHTRVLATARASRRDAEPLFRELLDRWLGSTLTEVERRAPYACFAQAWGSLADRTRPKRDVRRGFVEPAPPEAFDGPERTPEEIFGIIDEPSRQDTAHA